MTDERTLDWLIAQLRSPVAECAGWSAREPHPTHIAEPKRLVPRLPELSRTSRRAWSRQWYVDKCSTYHLLA
jgi:hypothetical protein